MLSTKSSAYFPLEELNYKKQWKKPYGILWYFFHAASGAGASITVSPENTAVLSGNGATLRCISSLGSSAIFWKNEEQMSQTGSYTVYACSVQSGFTAVFTVNSSSPGQCDLIVPHSTTSFLGPINAEIRLRWAQYIHEPI